MKKQKEQVCHHRWDQGQTVPLDKPKNYAIIKKISKRGKTMKGLFITLEGPDGSGKTTVSTGICQRLRQQGLDVVYTREPGGIEIAEQIRKVILDPANTAMDDKTEALLYAASRRQHLVEKVIPALQAGKIVVCDRFIDSSLAYQGIGRHLGIEAVMKINEFAIEGCFPDKTIYLDLSPEEGLKRIENRRAKDRLDQEALSFHQQVARGYKQIAALYPQRIVSIDASQSVEKVIDEACAVILSLVENHDQNAA